MTLEELGKQYEEQWKTLMEKIRILHKEAENLPPEKKLKLMRKIRSLLDSAILCRENAKHLTEYYKRSEHR